MVRGRRIVCVIEPLKAQARSNCRGRSAPVLAVKAEPCSWYITRDVSLHAQLHSREKTFSAEDEVEDAESHKRRGDHFREGVDMVEIGEV